jgi:hypothetical protein
MVKKTAASTQVMIAPMSPIWSAKLWADPPADLGRLGGIVDPHDVPADDPLPPLTRFVEVVVTEEELGGVGTLLLAVVDADQVELPERAAVLPPEDRPLNRDPVADLPTVALRGLAAHDRALAVGEPGGLLVGGQQQLRIHREVVLGIDGGLEDPLEAPVRVLVDAAEPAHVGDRLDPRDAGDFRLVALRQRQDDRSLLGGEQAVGAGHVDAGAESHLDRREVGEEHEGDDDREQREERPRLAPLEVPPEERPVLHAAASTSTPFSRWRMRDARSAAWGSWVTMMIVLP